MGHPAAAGECRGALQRASSRMPPAQPLRCPPDHTRALPMQLRPQALRLRLMALRAFNLETLLVGEQVKSKEPLVMQIR